MLHKQKADLTRPEAIRRLVELGSQKAGQQRRRRSMKESTLAKITASVRVAKGMAERVLAASPNPQWTEYELQTIDEWIARQGVKLDRSEAIRRLVEIGLKAKENERA
jgi:hypothetical protein